MTTDNYTANSSNFNSDYSLLNQQNGWLNRETQSFECGCKVYQGTAVTSIFHPEYSGSGLPFVDNFSTVNNSSTETYLIYGLPFVSDSSSRNHTYSSNHIPYVEPPLNAVRQAAEIPPVDFSDTFKLHSKPDAKHTIYLDFDGHVTENTGWKGGDRIESPAYERDNNVNSFNDEEREEIQHIWQRVAEDFAPFNVNVTTEEPDIEDLRNTGNGDEKWGIRVVLTQDDETLIAPGSGGVAFFNSFNDDIDTPVFVFNHGEVFAADTVSHEVGHALGLNHDGKLATDSSEREEYYNGHGSGATGWGTIMGASFYKTVSQWSKGEYYLANNSQDDLEVITSENGFGYRADDYGNTNATAFELTASNTNTLNAFGIIEGNTDIDVFSFVTGAGNVSLKIDPSSQVYISDGNGNYRLEYLDSRGANLDIWAGIYSADGTLVAESNPVESLFASFDLFLDGGEYYIHVDGIGKGNPFAENPDGYTDYGSLGQYEISGTIVAPPDDVISIAATDANKNEGDSGNTSFTFTVTRNGDTSGVTTVDWQVTAATDNSADANDFINGVFPTGTITFNPGETSRQITIEVSSDEDIEVDENFVVKLSNLSNGTFAPDAAIGTIESDDAEIRGIKWYDANQNGIKDADEIGLADWTIFIDANQNGLLDNGEISTTTATDGSYILSNVTPGTHSILEVVQTGWQQTFPVQLQGEENYQLDDGVSNANVTWGKGDTMIFNSFDVQAGLETINFISVRLSDNNPKAVFIYQDADGDKQPDGNEKLIEVPTNFTETSGFGEVAINPTTVSGTFFVGALYEGNGTSNTWIPQDKDNPQGKSWVDTTNAGEFNPDNLSVFDGGNRNFLLRAHSGGIPQQVTVNGGEVVSDINFGNYRGNIPPVADNDNATIDEESTINGNVLTNDTDIQNDSLEVIEVNGSTANVGNQITLASGALLTLNADGTFSYNPNSNFESLATGATATDSFTYKVSDGNGGSDTATATIIINGVNDAPVVDNIIANQTASENVAFNFTIPGNIFSDVDTGDNLTYTATQQDGSTLPTWLNFNPATLEFSGTPQNQDTGVIEIKVTVTDGGNESVFDIFALTIGNVKNPPQLTINTLTISEGGTVTLTLLNLSATDSDNDEANLIFTASNITGGKFEVDGVENNSFTQQQITDDKVKFIHDGNENAPSYDITVSDSNLNDSSSATVNFTNLNDAPTDIALSNSSVAENDIAAVIGNITVTDVDSNNFTYSVSDNRFQVVNSQLKLKDGESLDFETESSITLEITATDDGNPNQSFTKSFTLTVTNVNEGITIAQSNNSTDVSEAGTTDTYTVVLNSKPISDVSINIDAGSQATTDTTSLTFTNGNWNIAQTVTVSAVDDAIIEANHSQTITHTVTSSGNDYNGITVDSINVNITDNDIKPLTQINSELDIFNISRETGKPKLQVTLNDANADTVNELGVFAVDD
ncbi:MAG: putative Ig domain-containing protein, partial [Cyanobacteria bacterium J06633_8]